MPTGGKESGEKDDQGGEEGRRMESTRPVQCDNINIPLQKSIAAVYMQHVLLLVLHAACVQEGKNWSCMCASNSPHLRAHICSHISAHVGVSHAAC